MDILPLDSKKSEKMRARLHMSKKSSKFAA